MGDFLILGLIGVGTLGMRAVFLVTPARLPGVVERGMQHAKPAILAALVGAFVAGGEGGLAIAPLAALGVAAVLARRGASMIVVLVAAMVVATLLG